MIRSDDPIKLGINKCEMCGKAFVGAEGLKGFCSDCRDEVEHIYRSVRDLVRDNPDRPTTIEDASRYLGISEEKIIFLCRRGYFHMAGGAGNLAVLNAIKEDMMR